MKIAVVDDEKYAREELIYQIHENLPDAVITEASTGAAATELISKEEFDIIFLDIRLGDIMGTTLAGIARRLWPRMQIIFSSAYSEYGVEAFELGANDYILKPYDPARVRQVLEKSCAVIEKRKQAEAIADESAADSRIAISCNRRSIMLDRSDIVYLESEKGGHQCIFHLIDGSQKTASDGLLQWEKKLEGSGFFRIHKTMIVQLCYIEDIFYWSTNSYAIHVKNYKNILPVSRDRIKELRLALGIKNN